MASLSVSARQILRRVVPVRARLAIHRRYEALTERLEQLLGRGDPLLPPTRLMFAGGSRRAFRALGDKWLRTFVRLADLKPDDGVLDAGSGVGRMAVALTRVRNRCQETLSIRKAARARAYHLWGVVRAAEPGQPT